MTSEVKAWMSNHIQIFQYVNHQLWRMCLHSFSPDIWSPRQQTGSLVTTDHVNDPLCPISTSHYSPLVGVESSHDCHISFQFIRLSRVMGSWLNTKSSVLQWLMSVKTSQITNNSTVCWTACSDKQLHSILQIICEGNGPLTGGFTSERASNV